MKHILISVAAAGMLVACGDKKTFDATGTFEATEIVVSSEAAGRILRFDVEEGQPVEVGAETGVIDSLPLHLQYRQVRAQQAALLKSRPDIQKQVVSLREQIANQKSELERVRNLLKDGAAAPKQVDDMEARIRVLEGELSAALSTLGNNTAALDENAAALDAQAELLADRIRRCRIVSPVSGTVLVKYAQAGEMTAVGKPLMKVADLENLSLRAYFTSEQLAAIQVGDSVRVTADFGGDTRFDYGGRITWIASESEFTPKTIQTRNSRSNLVYAVKIAVKNDGRLKIGLSGEVFLP